MRTQFNKSVVASLPVGTHQDSKQSGLVCNVTATSRKYGVYIWANGKPVRKSIGDASHMSVEVARIRAAEVIRELRSAPKVQRKVVTLGQLADMFTTHLEMQQRRTAFYVEDAMRLNWDDMRGRDIETITVLELAERHNKIAKERGPSAARRAISTLRTMYHYAASLELTERNPAKKVRLVPEKSREVYLSGEQIGLLRRVLKTMPQVVEDYFLVSLLTGLRRSNVCGMRVEWLDLDGGICTVPAEFSKNGKQLTTVLVSEAVEILRRRCDGASEWVFPSAKSSCGHLVEPWFWLEEVREKMAELGCTVPFHFHDLRRSFAVALTAAGAPLTVVASSLGHTNVSSTPIYARASVDTVREYLSRVA